MINLNENLEWFGNKPHDWIPTKIKYEFIFSKDTLEDISGERFLSITQKGIIEKDIESNEGQIAESYDDYIKVNPGEISMNPMDLKTGWVDVNKISGLMSPAYYTLRNIGKNCDTYFINYLFQSNYKRKVFFKYGQGIADHSGAGRWVINPETLKDFKIFVPPIAKQKIIVKFLDKKTKLIDQLIENIEKKIKVLNQHHTSQINQYITKGLNPEVQLKDSGIPWVGKIPINWEIIKFKYLFEIKTGRDPSSIYEDEGQYDVLGTGGIIGKTNMTMFNKTSLIIGRKGTIDKPFIQITPFWISDVVYYTIPKSYISPNYLWFLFTQIDFDFYKYGSTLPSMSSEDYENMKFPVPPESELLKIESYLNNLNEFTLNFIKLNNEKINLLNEYKQSLISSAVTGKFEITEDMV